MKYEVVLMTKPSLTEEQNKKVLDSVKDLIKSSDGKIEKEDLWGKRKLAYEIKGMQECYYASFDFTLTPTSLKKVTSKFNLLPEVVRYLVIKGEGK
ncbi:MAG: 30S ribosomal protein S6 [Patescibacteria group bacterium]